MTSFSFRFFFWVFIQVFADDATSWQPIEVSRNLIWNLRTAKLFCGSHVMATTRGVLLVKWSIIQENNVCMIDQFVLFSCIDETLNVSKSFHFDRHFFKTLSLLFLSLTFLYVRHCCRITIICTEVDSCSVSSSQVSHLNKCVKPFVEVNNYVLCSSPSRLYQHSFFDSSCRLFLLQRI